jgi:hypothetical protein
MTVCTVGAAYLVNLASSGGPTLTVVLLLVIATLLSQFNHQDPAGQGDRHPDRS